MRVMSTSGGGRRSEFGCRQVNQKADDGFLGELAAANAEPADLDQAGQFGCRPHAQLSRICVQMDTVVADQDGRGNLPGTAA